MGDLGPVEPGRLPLLVVPASGFYGAMDERHGPRASPAPLTVADWMTRNVVTVTPHTSVLNARRLLATYGIRHLPVVDGGVLVGLLSDRDLRPADPAVAWALATLRSDLVAGRYRTVSTVMSSPVVVARPGESIAAASRRMIDDRIGALPVVEGRRLVGILSLVDCLRAFLETLPEDERSLAAMTPRPQERIS